MKQLLEAGVHFGHQTRRWNPKMAPYIFMERNGIYIIDLQKTVDLIDEAYDFIRGVAETGKPILFVGTKKQAQQVIKEESLRSESYFVNERWLGGMLTNYKTISERIRRLYDIEKMEDEGVFEQLTKKEVSKLRLEHEKLEKFLGGIKEMKGMPGALFVVDPKKEKIAVSEARILGIPIVGIVDTNCDPEDVDLVIPANDDAIRSIKLITAAIADAVIEANQGVSFAEAPADDADEADAEGVEEGDFDEMLEEYDEPVEDESEEAVEPDEEAAVEEATETAEEPAELEEEAEKPAEPGEEAAAEETAEPAEEAEAEEPAETEDTDETDDAAKEED